ncbi:MAG: DUF2190 family protein [Kiritimatiellae bacterium]|jgi:predicted RecA/RadA family phage recombinase|nr:DUF2190 family protein [Kiritimatiellia bacterium]
MAISSTAAKFRKTGDTLDYTAGADIPAGKIIKVDGLLCIALSPIANGKTGALKVLHRGEVVEVTTNEAIGSTNAGVAIYVDSDGLATKTSTSNTLLGYTRAAVGSSDLSFEVVCV